MESYAIALIVYGAMAAIYFFPWIIAFYRYHHNVVAIFVLNLFLGWTFIGWLTALVWACTYIPVEANTRSA